MVKKFEITNESHKRTAVGSGAKSKDDQRKCTGRII